MFGFLFVSGVRVTTYVVAESGLTGGERARALVCERPCASSVLVGAGQSRVGSGCSALIKPHVHLFVAVILLFSDVGGPGGWPEGLEMTGITKAFLQDGVLESFA